MEKKIVKVNGKEMGYVLSTYSGVTGQPQFWAYNMQDEMVGRGNYEYEEDAIWAVQNMQY